jgi:hypothetical protein
LLVRQNLEQLAHPGHGVGIDRHLLGTGVGRRPFRNGLRGVGKIAADGTVRVGHLVRGNAVHESQERAAAIAIARQRHDGGQANLLCHIIGRQTAAL